MKDTWTQIGHSVLCQTYGPFVDIKRHCHNVTRFFIFENPYDPDPIASWFQIASGIMQVRYISDLFDDSGKWCGPAIDSENEISAYHSRFIAELTRFNFIWSGLEAYVDSVSFPKCPNQSGKINSINYFLKNNYLGKYPSIEYYPEVMELFKKLIIKHPYLCDFFYLFSEVKCASEELIGLKVVYKIRNLFAHGAFKISEPEDFFPSKPVEIAIINLSSRIVLMTMQMLLLSTCHNLKFKVAQLHQPEEKGTTAKIFLSKMHLKSYKNS